MTRFMVSIEGPDTLEASDVQGTLQHMLPSDQGWEVNATSTRGTTFASVSVFSEDMTEISRGVQQLPPDESATKFQTQYIRQEEDGLVMYITETTFKRTRVEDSGVEWSPSARRGTSS